MASTTSKIGHGLAKGLGIKLDYRDETGNNKLSRGESVFSVTSADSYQEEEPTSAEWLASIWPSKQDTWRYIRNLFPFTHWITRYNLQWLYGDLVAGKSSCASSTIKLLLTRIRYHYRRRRRATEYGIC